MIIHNLDVHGSGRAIGPLEADAPLGVDADAVLSFAVAPQSLEAIPRQGGEVSKGGGGLQTVQLQACGALESRECLNALPSGKGAGALIPEAEDHPGKFSGQYVLRQA